jgi:dihydrofolate reductase
MLCSVFIATSLDGFIAREDGSLDWLPAGGGEEHGYTNFIAGIDVIVVGRMTYETVMGFDAWPSRASTRSRPRCRHSARRRPTARRQAAAGCRRLPRCYCL